LGFGEEGSFISCGVGPFQIQERFHRWAISEQIFVGMWVMGFSLICDSILQKHILQSVWPVNNQTLCGDVSAGFQM